MAGVTEVCGVGQPPPGLSLSLDHPPPATLYQLATHWQAAGQDSALPLPAASLTASPSRAPPPKTFHPCHRCQPYDEQSETDPECSLLPPSLLPPIHPTTPNRFLGTLPLLHASWRTAGHRPLKYSALPLPAVSLAASPSPHPSLTVAFLVPLQAL